MACLKASLSGNAQLKSLRCSLWAIVAAWGPHAAVRPSGFTSVLPSIGFSPFLATAKYTSTYMPALRSAVFGHMTLLPLCMPFAEQDSRPGAPQAAVRPPGSQNSICPMAILPVWPWQSIPVPVCQPEISGRMQHQCRCVRPSIRCGDDHC